MSKYLWLLDAGHGGMKNGMYQTEGKRSPKWPDGSILYEGEFNRAVASRLMEKMTSKGLRYMQIHDSMDDTSLSARVSNINYLDRDYNNCILLSIHANAGGGHGWEVYTSRGETDSDKIATVFADKVQTQFPYARIRGDMVDGDVDKEANFYILTKTNCPAILTENFFMDNQEECQCILNNPEGRNAVAEALFQAIFEIEKNGY